MNGCRNSENVGQVEELLLMTEQMQDELDQKDQTIQELNRQLSESLTLNEKLNSENNWFIAHVREGELTVAAFRRIHIVQAHAPS